jgi:cardiolipin synthase (CMP-forming)
MNRQGAMNIPNLLTLLRFIMIPVFGYFLLSERYFVALIIFAIAGLTDFADGYIARKYQMITAFGEFADPMADKLLQATAVLILYHLNILPFWVVFIVFGKEILMAIGAFALVLQNNVVVPAHWCGKVASVILFCAVTFALALRLVPHPYAWMQQIVLAGFFLGVMTTLYALWKYTLNFIHLQKEIKSGSNIIHGKQFKKKRGHLGTTHE